MRRWPYRWIGIVALAATLLAGPASGNAGAMDRSFPVRGSSSYGSTHHDYPATDIFAACGARVVAPVRGRVLEVSRRDRWNPDTDRPAHRGGKFFSIRGADGVRYYGSHLRSLAAATAPGTMVRRGQPLGRVGRTGNARSTPCHLHFGLSPVCSRTGDWAIRRGVVSPYPYLRSWQRGKDRSPRRDVEQWRRRHGCSGSLSSARPAG